MILDKDEPIRVLVDKLDLNGRGWVIVDHWDADRCALGLAHRRDHRRLVYVSSFGMQPGHFHYECEAGERNSSEGYETVSEGDVGSFDELVNVLQRHLGGS